VSKVRVNESGIRVIKSGGRRNHLEKTALPKVRDNVSKVRDDTSSVGDE